MYLIIINLQLLLKCFRSQVFEPVYESKAFYSVQSRLNLLMTQITLEMKMTVPKMLMRPVSFRYSPSTNTIRVREICQNLADRKAIDKAVLECPVKSLPIPGVTVRKGGL